MTIQLLVTDRIRNAINDVLELEGTSEALREELGKWRRTQDGGKRDERNMDASRVEDISAGNNSTIPFKTVNKVVKLLNEAGTVIYLNELVEESGLYFEPVEEPKKSPELIARLKKLQAKQEQARYRTMVKNIDRELIQKNSKEMAFEVRSTSRQLSSVVNFALSVAGTFVFGFMSSQFAFTNIGLRVMFGIMLASIVALAELYFMARTEI